MSQQLQIPAVSIDELIRNKSHKAQSLGQFLHIVNVQSGKTEYILKKGYNPAVRTRMVQQTLPNGDAVLVEEDIDNQFTHIVSEPLYSEVTVDLLCEHIVNGMSLTKACDLPDMPSYSTLARWRRIHPAVQERIDQARFDRAEAMRDKAMEDIESMDDVNYVHIMAKHKAYQWAAGVDDPNRYSPKAKIEASINNPTQILVYTGIGGPPEANPPPQTTAVKEKDAEK